MVTLRRSAWCPFAILVMLVFVPVLRAADDAPSLRAEAEAAYAEGSFAIAHDLYERLSALDLEPEVRSWVDFRLADTSWRASSRSSPEGAERIEAAEKRLDALAAAYERPETRDRIWAEIRESRGDLLRTVRYQPYDAIGAYADALDWWAGARDVETGRRKYLDMVLRMASSPWNRASNLDFVHVIPANVIENARTIAVDGGDVAATALLLAISLEQRGGTWAFGDRVRRAYEDAITRGAGGAWLDDALFRYGQFLENQGRLIIEPNGVRRVEPDFVAALDQYRTLVRTFDRGRSPYVDQANAAITRITEPTIDVMVPQDFLPGSQITYTLGWRNVGEVLVAVHKLDLLDVVTPDQVDAAALARVDEYRIDTADDGTHRPGAKVAVMDRKLPTGAYLLVASGGGRTARSMLLVTDVAVVTKTVGDRMVTSVCSAIDGAPVADASVRVREFIRDRGGSAPRLLNTLDATTNADGLCEFTLNGTRVPDNHRRAGFSVFATAAERQTYQLDGNSWTPGARNEWRLYAVTDRAAYRPEDTVQWKFTARAYDGSGYRTPANQTMTYRIRDPQGAVVGEGEVTLNAFGAAWGELALSPSMALGEYGITLNQNGRDICGATLFRLEEYKLPEFEVTVTTPKDEQGKPRAYRLGERVEATIDAAYYFGGPVTNASVEVVVSQRSFSYFWPSRSAGSYSWYREDPRRHWWRPVSEVLRQTVTTDDEGRATIGFDAPEGQGDLEFIIAAQVTDSSRREVTGQGTVRVTNDAFAVSIEPERRVVRPQQPVDLMIRAKTANDDPVAVKGIVRITREQWVEVWLDPMGRQITGEALDAFRISGAFPPPAPPGTHPWMPIRRGYESTEILVTNVTTDDAGDATLAFTPPKAGYYRIAWTTPQEGRTPIVAETVLFVADLDTAVVGIQPGGVQLVVDKDTFRVGQAATALIMTPVSNRWVLFTVEGDALHDIRVVHVEGNAKLVRIDVDERYLPNVTLSVLAVSEAQVTSDSKEIVVPPVSRFLTVDVASDREAYEPGEVGTVTVTTKDVDGRPVSAEVSLAVVDAAIDAIQTSYAADPREFFYNDRQQQRVATSGSLMQRRLAYWTEPVEAPEDQRWNERAGVGGWDSDGFAPLGLTQNELSVGGMRLMRKAGSEMAPPSSAPMERMAADSLALGQPAGGEAPDTPGAPVIVRQDFRATIFWKPDVRTDADGRATVEVTYGDSLTRWAMTARAITPDTKVGMGTASSRTRLPLIARLQAPRFFVVGDETMLSGVFNNNTDEALVVTPTLEVENLVVTGMMRDGRAVPVSDAPITVSPNAEARVDWLVQATAAGPTTVRLTGRSQSHSDGMERTYLVHPHGVEKFLAHAGAVKGEAVTVRLDLPAARRAGSTSLDVTVSPSLAISMLDALPYLIDYPYGCTEQTMSRFLPSAIVARTIEQLGLSPEEAMAGVYGGVEAAFVDKTHPAKDGRVGLERLADATAAGLERLYDFQHGDGGWGWWKDGSSDHYMTAYVVWGLSLAQQAGIAVRPDVLARGAAYLDTNLVKAEFTIELQAWMLHALTECAATVDPDAALEHHRRIAAELWAKRRDLSACGRSLLAISLHHLGETEQAKTLIRNLADGVIRDDAPDTSILIGTVGQGHPATIGTLHWGQSDRYWRWWEGGIETTSFAIRAMTLVDPDNEMIEPAVNWLVKNRRGGQWTNTRDSAIAIIALSTHVARTNELAAGFRYEVRVNGTVVATREVSRERLLEAVGTIHVDPATLRSGVNDIEIRRLDGAGPIYFATHATFFSEEEPVTAAGNEIFVRRDYYRLSPRQTLLKGVFHDRTLLRDGDYVTSGDRIEVVVTVESKNDYEYLVFEDLKPAGLEAVDLRSGGGATVRQLKPGAVDRRFADGVAPDGEPRQPGVRPYSDYTGGSRGAHRELRDRLVAVFLDRLPRGTWEFRYDLRAEVPGRFHALPVLGHAMYVPEIRCNSDEIRLNVNDR